MIVVTFVAEGLRELSPWETTIAMHEVLGETGLGVIMMALSALGLVSGLGALVASRTLENSAAVRLGAGLFVALLTCVGLSIVQAVPDLIFDSSLLAAIGGASLLVILGILPARAIASGLLTPAGRRALPLALVLVSIGLYGWQIARPDNEGDALPVIAPSIADTRDLTSEHSVTVYTDRTQAIPVYVNLSSDGPNEAANAALLASRSLSGLVTQVAPADPSSNCHGWVFTGGRYHVKGVSVDQILKDNAYVEVTDPRAGDLIVYRDEAGKVIHSGIVRSQASDDKTMIESKWGLYGRFLHEARDQIYGQNFAFYRSVRTGHQLAGLEGDAYASRREIATVVP